MLLSSWVTADVAVIGVMGFCVIPVVATLLYVSRTAIRELREASSSPAAEEERQEQEVMRGRPRAA